jgi:ACT domain-containing protein
MANYAIKQISIFLENKPGRLAEVAEAMNEAKINILAFSIAEAGDFGVVRMLLTNLMKRARNFMRKDSQSP